MKLLFLDTETLGLDPDAPVWEFAAILRTDRGQQEVEFFIEHDPTGWLDYRDDLKADYLRRYDARAALSEPDAAATIANLMKGRARIVGSNPGFDTERLGKLLRRNGHEPQHHYHSFDVGALLVGYLAAHDLLPAEPWSTDQLAAMSGVNPARYARHTAMGDVVWTQDIWDRVMGPTA
jgi:hypothetical protein